MKRAKQAYEHELEFARIRRRVVKNHDTGDEDRQTCCGMPVICEWFSGIDAVGFYDCTLIGCNVCEVYTYRGEKVYRKVTP